MTTKEDKQKCLQPGIERGVLLTNPPKYRCDRVGCSNNWIVGTDAPDCMIQPDTTKAVIERFDENFGTIEKRDLQTQTEVEEFLQAIRDFLISELTTAKQQLLQEVLEKLLKIGKKESFDTFDQMGGYNMATTAMYEKIKSIAQAHGIESLD